MDQSQVLAPGGRLRALREAIASHGLDGVIVPRFDEHQGEYCAHHDERLAYVTGFTGSAGIALILADRAIIFVDGRYQVQVRCQVDLTAYEIEHFEHAPIERWLEQNCQSGLKVGLNQMLIPSALYHKLNNSLRRNGGELRALPEDPVDAIWQDQPMRPTAPITSFPVSLAGESSADKCHRIAQRLRLLGADMLIETQPDNIAWLLNVRGGDVAFNPIPQSFLLLSVNEGAEWFVDDRKLPRDRASYELDGVSISSPEQFLRRVRELAKGQVVMLDPELTSVAAELAVGEGGGTLLVGTSPIALAKAVKNETELDGFRAAHLEDGVAWVEFLAWIHEEVSARFASGSPVTELEAEAQILLFRQRRRGFVYPSFRSISAASSNAAMCHYAASDATNAPLGASGIYLLDSGGHYWGGTTDATRTVAVGKVDYHVRRAYTAVLKGFVALMTLRFPVGTCGHQIDAFARRPLWELGLDYDHGTGHGVGHFLSVHEQPHRIAKEINNYPIEAGLVCTVEPGYYRAGEFGLRIENQVEVVKAGEGFLRFESLTRVPIDLDLADRELLTVQEVSFLNSYHARVRELLLDIVPAPARQFLVDTTMPVCR